MLAIGRIVLVPALVLCCFGLAARAQTDNAVRDVKAMPGKDVRVAAYANIRPDCTSGPLPSIRLLVAPAHGKVTVKRGTLKATNMKECLATEVPVLVALYRAADNFNGSDTFDLEISFSDGRKQVQHFQVHVSGGQGGQGI